MSTTQTIFDITAPTYDADRAKLIPCFDAFYRRTTDLIAHDAKNILDLGAGTGLLSQFVRQWYPDAHIVLADLSEPMIAKARERFADDNNVTFEVTDYTTAPINGTYDSIVSALSIHHLEDERKHALLRPIFTALRPGGFFINADHIAGPTPELEETYQLRWLADVRANGATEQQIADSLFRQQEDRRTPVATQLAWLRAEGFINVDCWYKHSSFAVMSGTRPR